MGDRAFPAKPATSRNFHTFTLHALQVSLHKTNMSAVIVGSSLRDNRQNKSFLRCNKTYVCTPCQVGVYWVDFVS
jgi:hypothetical protein